MMTEANLLFVTIVSLCLLSSTLYFILWLHCISLESSYWMACLFHMTNHYQLRMCISIYPNLILNCGTIFTYCDIEIREPGQHCAYYILIRWLCLTVWWSSPGDIMQCFVDWVFPFNLLHGFLIQCVILSSNWDMQHTYFILNYFIMIFSLLPNRMNVWTRRCLLFQIMWP